MSVAVGSLITMRAPLLAVMLGLSMAAAACSTEPSASVPAPAPDPITTEEMTALLETSSEPVVLNVWASWCIPCRSEAPMLSRAAATFDNRVRFVGLNVRDGPSDAGSFIAEFFPETPIEHYADASGAIPIDLGGNRGVPLTYFYAPGGELRHLHRGVIDERTLALQIDELLAG